MEFKFKITRLNQTNPKRLCNKKILEEENKDEIMNIETSIYFIESSFLFNLVLLYLLF